jgi:hypothetical protein
VSLAHAGGRNGHKGLETRWPYATRASAFD